MKTKSAMAPPGLDPARVRTPESVGARVGRAMKKSKIGTRRRGCPARSMISVRSSTDEPTGRAISLATL
eukprot:4064375-Pyramimonas_sp.AAC.1